MKLILWDASTGLVVEDEISDYKVVKVEDSVRIFRAAKGTGDFLGMLFIDTGEGVREYHYSSGKKIEEVFSLSSNLNKVRSRKTILADASNFTERFAYGQDGRLLRVYNSEVGTLFYHRNECGQLETVSDERGQILRKYLYDEEGGKVLVSSARDSVDESFNVINFKYKK
jgi:hypothetical protein